MSTFYLLPRRAETASRFAAYLQTWFPGVYAPADELPDLLAGAAEQSGAIVVFGDDLPAGGRDLDGALREAFGAEPRDRIIDMRSGPAGAESSFATWVVGRAASRPAIPT